jgi:alanine racemase
MADQVYKVSKIREIIRAKGNLAEDVFISQLATDSRKINAPAGSLFFALTGIKDGHQFIPDLYAMGVRNFVVNHIPDDCSHLANSASFLIVSDVLAALQQLAAYHRRQFNLKVIGITGSNGKTTVKEWLYQLLSPYQHIVRNPKSYNSQIGVPLSVWQISAEYDLGIFEAAISTRHEMKKLTDIIQPQVGILTHIGSAHDEGFSSRNEKISEKLQLFNNCELLIYNPDMLSAYEGEIPGSQKFTWSRNKRRVAVNLYVFNEINGQGKTQLQALYKGAEISCSIPFINEAAIENAVICWATLLALGYSHDKIAAGMENLAAVRMRMELKSGIHNCSVIDDSYNSDVQSLQIALDFLNQQNQHQKRTLILSDIYQSGLNVEELYQEVSRLVYHKNVDRLIGVGQALTQYQHFFKQAEQHFFPDTQTMLGHMPELRFENETILIKGSRSFRFELISKRLVQKAHETILQINLNAMQNNLGFYKSQLLPGVKLMAMVKAFSYGSGTFEIANLLQFNHVDYLAVAYADEGVGLRQAGITLPIMVMNPAFASFDKIAEYRLEPEIFSLNVLEEFLSFAKGKNLEHYPVHLKIDTGMHRLGFEAADMDLLCQILSSSKEIKVVSVLSHLVGSESAEHDDFSLMQVERFKMASRKIEQAIGYEVIRHIANTSAISRWPDFQFDMVRLGIGLYGIDGAFAGQHSPLQQVATLRTSVSQVKQLKAGETVGYSRKGIMQQDGKIATVRIGYADGYLRAFGNGVGQMLIKGKLCKTIGNICMDMCMLDVTGMEVEEGDEVIIFNEDLKVETVATQIGTIAYEILTSVSQRVKRVYYYE